MKSTLEVIKGFNTNKKKSKTQRSREEMVLRNITSDWRCRRTHWYLSKAQIEDEKDRELLWSYFARLCNKHATRNLSGWDHTTFKIIRIDFNKMPLEKEEEGYEYYPLLTRLHFIMGDKDQYVSKGYPGPPKLPKNALVIVDHADEFIKRWKRTYHHTIYCVQDASVMRDTFDRHYDYNTNINYTIFF